MAKTVVESEMTGSISLLHVDDGDLVEAGDNVLAIELMKTQNDIPSPVSGRVHFLVALGELVEQDQPIFEITGD